MKLTRYAHPTTESGYNRYHVKKDGEEFNVRVPTSFAVNQTGNREQNKIVRTLLQYIPKERQSGKIIEIDGKCYTWISRSEAGIFQRILSVMSRSILPSQSTFFDLVNVTHDTDNHPDIVLGPKDILSDIEIEGDFAPGVMAQVYKDTVGSDTTMRFMDPYTQLSREAFQYHELNVGVGEFEKCTTRLVEFEGKVALVGADNAEFSNGDTVKNYLRYIVGEYGEDKIRYIEHLYKFKFSEMISENKPLTPEHVFRVNMGVTNVEIQDVQHFYNKLQHIYRSYTHDEFNRNVKELTGSEKKALVKMMGVQGDAQMVQSDLVFWFFGQFMDKTFEMLSSSQIESLAESLVVQGSEREIALTGRAIQDLIVGSYTDDPLTEYKPWLDQQHLIQSFEEYEGGTNWPAFHEMLAFVIVKMHLAREHPTETYRVGALIPTPLGPDGKQHWYKVTSCVSSGTFSYTLEGVGNDSLLPPIKLYRSTSTSPYAMHGHESVKNDLNPFNSPGYLGMGLGDQYEESFFTKRTIPVWVGYTMDAESRLDKHNEPLEDVVESLQKANQTLVECSIKSHQPKGMKDILRSHDSILMDILQSTLGITHILPAVFNLEREGGLSKLPTLLTELANRYIHNPASVPSGQLKKDGENLNVLLKMLCEKQKLTPGQKTTVEELIKDIEFHIITPEKALGAYKARSAEVNKKYEHLKQLKGRMEASQDANVKKSIAREWTKTLLELATEQNEHPDQKKKDDLVILGHSLGASCSQINIHHFITAKDRMPLPGHKVEMHGYDGPGINSDDNQAFKTFGNRHAGLLKNHKITFDIHHSQEAGDFIPFGGQEHLGSGCDKEEAAKLEAWMKFKTEVFERLPNPKHKSIARSSDVHATRYHSGKKDIDYKLTEIDSLTQGLVDRGTDPKANELKYNVWKLGYLTSQLNETFRIWSNNAILLAVKSDKESERGKDKADSRGVLAVNESGVASIK